MYCKLFVLVLVCAAFSAATANTARRGKAVGAPMKANADDDDVQEALTFAMREFNKGSNDMYVSKATRVVSVEKQLVAGINYFIEVEVGRTTCTKPTNNIETCNLHVEPNLAKSIHCSFTVYIIPWKGISKLSKNECH
ncbi:cystatin [Bombina bombina]|uniref:cystatin n=1 Tax=Bombina bombina TaxID=8345 RepID=UPI00235A8C98|nr:cystatin [Bombina bombina]